MGISLEQRSTTDFGSHEVPVVRRRPLWELTEKAAKEQGLVRAASFSIDSGTRRGPQASVRRPSQKYRRAVVRA